MPLTTLPILLFGLGKTMHSDGQITGANEQPRSREAIPNPKGAGEVITRVTVTISRAV